MGSFFIPNIVYFCLVLFFSMIILAKGWSVSRMFFSKNHGFYKCPFPHVLPLPPSLFSYSHIYIHMFMFLYKYWPTYQLKIYLEYCRSLKAIWSSLVRLNERETQRKIQLAVSDRNSSPFIFSLFSFYPIFSPAFFEFILFIVLFCFVLVFQVVCLLHYQPFLNSIWVCRFSFK